MAEQHGAVDERGTGQQDKRVQAAEERADRAEAELAEMKARPEAEPAHGKARDGQAGEPAGAGAHALHDPNLQGMDALRQDAMMQHLLEALDAGKDIGHYGRLVFAMVARHFLSDEDLIAELTKDCDFSAEQASGLLRQVEQRDYNPPRRERIVEWQSEQEFPILPLPEDPDCGNVYRSLHFPERTYKHIEEYQTEKSEEQAARES